MHFAHPDNLYLLLLLVPMVLALGGYFWWKRRLVERVGHSHLVQAMAAHHSNHRQVARGLLIICAVALLCIAAAQPQWGQDDRTIKRFGVDVVLRSICPTACSPRTSRRTGCRPPRTRSRRL